VRTTLLLVLLATEPAGITVQAQSLVPVDQDYCLDHAVKELGMSAKRVEGERRWVIGPQFLHSAVAKEGTLGVFIEKGATTSAVRVTATWPGAVKSKEVEEEIESRLVSMASKMAQNCGVTKPTVQCELKDAAGKASSCGPRQ
jgi:hypothetical protein